MPRFKSIIFYQNSPKIKLFLKKMQSFQALGTPLPDPHASGGWGLCPQTPNNGAPSRPNTAPHCEFLATHLANFVLFIITVAYMSFCSFCFEQFFLDRSVANLIMLIIDVCLMLSCFLFEKFYLHYALCDFDSILWHCTK